MLEIYDRRIPARGNRMQTIMGNKRNINSFPVRKQEWECTKGIFNIPRERPPLQKTEKIREKIPALAVAFFSCPPSPACWDWELRSN